jgi:hypothetical protein
MKRVGQRRQSWIRQSWIRQSWIRQSWISGLAATVAAVFVVGLGTAASAAPPAAPAFPASDYTHNTFISIACPTQETCFAVGNTEHPIQGAYGAFITKVTGTTLTPSVVPLPAGYTSVTLKSIACPSATSCIALGYLQNDTATQAGPHVAFSDTWNGTSWTTKVLDLGDFVPNALACGAPGYCVAGGETVSPSSTPRLIVLTGTTWKLLDLPRGLLFQPGRISDVACPGPSTCLAVGLLRGYLPKLPPQIGIFLNAATTYVVSGTSVRSVGNGTGLFRNGVLTSIRCTGPTACVATGSRIGSPFTTGATETPAGARPADRWEDGAGPLTETWNGKRWSYVAATGVPESGTSLLGCTSRTSCQLINDGGLDLLVGNLVDKTYTVAPLPKLIANATRYDLVEGTCRSATDCYAVGFTSQHGIGNNVLSRGLIAHFNGITWTQRILGLPGLGG